jgi:hypothetical protein
MVHWGGGGCRAENKKNKLLVRKVGTLMKFRALIIQLYSIIGEYLCTFTNAGGRLEQVMRQTGSHVE